MRARSWSSEPSAGSGRAPVIQQHGDRTHQVAGPVLALAEGAWNPCGSWPARGRRAVRSSSSAGAAITGTATAGRPALRRRAGRACSRRGDGTRRAEKGRRGHAERQRRYRERGTEGDASRSRAGGRLRDGARLAGGQRHGGAATGRLRGHRPMLLRTLPLGRHGSAAPDAVSRAATLRHETLARAGCPQHQRRFRSRAPG